MNCRWCGGKLFRGNTTGFDSEACYNAYTGDEVSDSTPTPQDLIDRDVPDSGGRWVWLSDDTIRAVLSYQGLHYDDCPCWLCGVVKSMAAAIERSEEKRLKDRVGPPHDYFDPDCEVCVQNYADSDTHHITTAISTPTSAASHYDNFATYPINDAVYPAERPIRSGTLDL